MEIEEPTKHVRIESTDNKNFEVKLVPNLARHVLVMGPEYTPESIRITSAQLMSTNMSGVLSKLKLNPIESNMFSFKHFHLVLGINKGTQWAYKLRQGSPILTYEIVGKLGTATESCFGGGKVLARATHGHVTAGKIQALVASMQATYQRQMFAMSGIDIQSQTAYELACKGLIRLKDISMPMIYGIRSIGNVRKTFTLEVQAMNVNEQYLSNMINTMGIQLRTAAHCSKIRCTRVGFFTYKQSLLRSHWNLQNVIQNMHECQKIWNEHPSMVSEEVSTPVGEGLNKNLTGFN